jgi:hypothetical protein
MSQQPKVGDGANTGGAAANSPQPQQGKGGVGDPKSSSLLVSLITRLLIEPLEQISKEKPWTLGFLVAQIFLGAILMYCTSSIQNSVVGATASDKKLMTLLWVYSSLVLVIGCVPVANVGLFIFIILIQIWHNKFSSTVKTNPNYGLLKFFLIVSLIFMFFNSLFMNWFYFKSVASSSLDIGKAAVTAGVAAGKQGTRLALAAGEKAVTVGKAAATAGYDAGKKGAGLVLATHTAATERAGQAGFADVLTMFIVSVSVALLSFLATQI